MIEIYLDENLSEYVADALNSLNKGLRNINVYSTKVKFGKGVPDEEIIPAIGKAKGILITKDTNIQRTKVQYQLCSKHKLGIFFLKPTKGLDTHWEIVKMLIINWQDIINIILTERLPYGYEIRTRGKMQRLKG